MLVGNKISIGALVALMFIICGWFYATPYITLYQLKKAVDAQDTVAISKHINFPALRENLKSSLTGKKASEKSNPFKSLKSALVNAMTDPMVDALVTPEGIAALMKGERLLGKKGRKGQESQKDDKDDQQYSMGYETFNRVVLRTKNKENSKEETAFVFTRDGLTWKLSGVRLTY